MARRGQNRNREVPQGRAIQYSDFDRPGQQAANRIMAERGRMASNVANVVQFARENPGTSNDKRMRGLKHLEGQVEDRKVTLASAAANRVEHFAGGIERTRSEGTDPGMGWYFGHHGDIADVAHRHGFGERKLDVMEASALMSPQNSPENEKVAVEAHLARHTGAPYEEKNLGRAGTKTNLQRSEEFLYRGGPGIPPTAPKIHSYSEAIKHAEPGTPEQREYTDRFAYVRDVLSEQQIAGQGRLDVWERGTSMGEQDPEKILSPTRNTAEDTWMHTISLGQDLTKTVGKTNIAKTASSDKRLGLVERKTDELGRAVHPAAEVGPSQVQHAWNNEATIRAARQLGESTGLVNEQGQSLVPSVMVQETAWTEARRVAGKDPTYNQHVRAQEKSARATERATAASKKERFQNEPSLWAGADMETGLPKSGEYKANVVRPRKNK